MDYTLYWTDLLYLSEMYSMWRYRYQHYRTDQHCTGTEYYRYSNRQRFCVYWFIGGDKWIYIQDR